ncbi:hypothetical protein [Kitasatospora sp. NPDC085464]|uniref:hypothetical protein n=1 Tax=Kitasatospora sp. NPDC085464 TaxID=3364063 RepID=UPI0037C8C6A3
MTIAGLLEPAIIDGAGDTYFSVNAAMDRQPQADAVEGRWSTMAPSGSDAESTFGRRRPV